MYKVTFKFEDGDDKEIFASEGENLLEVAKKANVAIDAPCSGNVSCGKCRVTIVRGEVESSISRHLTQEEYDRGVRLACNSKVIADVDVLVPDIAAAYQSRMKISDLSSKAEVKLFNDIKDNVQKSGISFTNDMKFIEIKMEVPTLDDTLPDNERVTRALKNAVQKDNIYMPYEVVRKLPDVLRANDFDVKVVVSEIDDRVEILDVLGMNDETKLYALAVDIGTTTVSTVLIDMQDGEILAKASSGNGQIRYGADVINRIIQTTKPGGIKKLQDAIIKETLNPIITNMCNSISIEPHQIYRICVAANTTMNHLFCGINADYLRQEPFIPVFFETHSFKGEDLGLIVNPNARIIIAPNIGSYVGGDITVGTLASMIWDKDEFCLFVDLGTNGEIVFGNKDLLMSCACSAGPAFEGGDISCGMRATDGAIESITIDKDTMEPTFKVIGDEKPIGLCGSGIIDIISELFRTGIINSKGKINREGDRIKTDDAGIKSYVIAFQKDAGSVKDVALTEVDIDNFIRAKGAIFSAIKTMLEMLEMPVEVIERVYIAGGIGSGINMANAVHIGMLPDIPLEKYEYIGNSSLTGCYCMLASNEAEQKVYDLARSMTYVELSNIPSYMDEFIAACFIPHTNASLFPSVEQ